MKIIFENFTNKSEEIILKKIIRGIENRENYLVVLPTYNILRHYQDLVLKELGGAIHLNFRTFDDFTRSRLSFDDRQNQDRWTGILIRKAIERC
ncbi:MAG: hypothetical protein Q4P25_05160, partial [Tissierellia bacterium]|nr:hypothetical protein [Tissierellia bacterium]